MEKKTILKSNISLLIVKMWVALQCMIQGHNRTHRF
jgi:hypothetical protein